MKKDAEIIRLQYKYRKLIIEGKITLPFKEAIKLLGPDTAYHLYSYREKEKNGK